MDFNISFTIFRFTFSSDVHLFKKLSMGTYNKYYTSAEFSMEKKHRLKVAPKNS